MQDLSKIYHILEKIANTSSHKDKVQIISDNADNSEFRTVLWASCSSHLNFNIKNFPAYKGCIKSFGLLNRNDTVFSVLKEISSSPGATKAQKERLFNAASLNKETYEVARRICNKDLCCGIGAALINDAIPKLIKIIPYQRCSTRKHIKNLDFEDGVYSQCKANGVFAYLNLTTGTFISRSGSVFKQLRPLWYKMLHRPSKLRFGMKLGLKHCFDRAIDKYRRDIMLMGELRVLNPDGTFMDRQTGNGIITSCIYGTADPEVVKHICYTVWDCITLDEYNACASDIAYRTRFFHAYQYVLAVSDSNVLRIIESKKVSNIAECDEFYHKMRSADEEGSIAKNCKGLWRNNDSTDNIKFKSVLECELRIVKAIPHSKDANKLGALLLESECKQLVVKCGTGFTEKDRKINWNERIGQIVTVEAEGIIQNKVDIGKYSLYTVSYIEYRADKVKADTLSRIIDIEKTTVRSSRTKSNQKEIPCLKRKHNRRRSSNKPFMS